MSEVSLVSTEKQAELYNARTFQKIVFYSTVSIESTIFIFEIFRSGIAVASKQAPTAKRVASRMG